MCDIAVLHGERITLRGPRESDVDDRFAAGKPDEFVYMCGGNRAENDTHPPRAVWEAWHKRTAQPQADEICWRMEADEICIGTIRLHKISKADNSARLAIGIWNMAYTSRGFGTEAIRLVLAYAFEQMRLHRVELVVLGYNKRAIRCYEKCGFVREGLLRENALVEGVYHSEVVMAILEQEYWNI